MTSSEPSAESDAAALASAVTMLGPRYDRRGGIGLENDSAGIQFRLWDAVETGSTDYRSLSVGDRIYISDQPARQLQPGPAFSSAHALLGHLDPDPVDGVGGGAAAHTPQATPGETHQSEWPQSVQDIIVRHADALAEDATRLLQRRPPRRERECSGCAGTGEVLGECHCIHLGPPKIVDLDAATTELAGPHEPNPGCSTCAGTGHRQRHCYDCGGTGVLAAPIPTTITIASNASFVIDGQPVALARRTPIAAQCTFGPCDVVVRWSIDTKAIIDQALTSVGLDPRRTVVRNTGRQGMEIPRWVDGTVVFRAMVEDGRVETAPPSPTPQQQNSVADPDWSTLLPTAEHIATDIEANLLASYHRMLPGTMPPNLRDEAAIDLGVVLDARGVPVSRALFVEPVPPIRRLLSDVAKAAAARGLYAMLIMDFIATGEWGPAVILLDSDLVPVTKGEASYTIEHALLSARDRL